MALLIRSAVNCARLAVRPSKRLIVARPNAPLGSSVRYSSKCAAAMTEHQVVPDVVAVAPTESVEVITVFCKRPKLSSGQWIASVLAALTILYTA